MSPNGTSLLQWSRDQLNAESAEGNPLQLGFAGLQWSRDQLNAESGDCNQDRKPAPSFNGAAIN